MARPRHENATPGELEVLQVLWERGPSTVREVMDVLNQSRRRAYTSVMSLLEVMFDKRLVKRRAQSRAFVYRAAVSKEKTLGQMVGDLVRRGSKARPPASSRTSWTKHRCRRKNSARFNN